jgi:predicted aldo/keto reductase-like oxidoreductase
MEAYPWDFTQIQYNYMDEHYQAGRAGLEKAYEMGVPVIIMEPLLGGKLATGLSAKAVKQFNDVDPNRSPAAWALKWLWDQPGVTCVLSGMNTMEQLDENVRAATDSGHGTLTEKERAVFSPVMDIIRESYKVTCTGCNYCLPCPHGVNIPGCFAAYNTRYAMGLIPAMTQYITGTGAHQPDKKARASFCVSCGVCVKKCPQHIDIPKELQNVTKKMEPFYFKLGLWIVRKFI